MDTLDEPVFTANLKNDTTGTYEFGKIDNTSFQGDLSWVPVNAASGFWEFNSTSFTINGETQQNPTGSPAIAGMQIPFGYSFCDSSDVCIYRHRYLSAPRR